MGPMRIPRPRPGWLLILAATLIILAFPPWDFTPLIWIGMVPFFLSLERARSLREALIQGFWMSLLLNLGAYYWIAYVLHEFGGLAWPLAILGWVLFGLINQPQFYLFTPLYRILRLARDRVPAWNEGFRAAAFAALIAALYSGIDWILPKLFTDTFGHAFYRAPWIRQLAELGGAYVLTFILVYVNLTLANLYLRLRAREEPSLWPTLIALGPQLTVAAVLPLIALGYGALRLPAIQSAISQPQARATMAVIQANIGDFDKVAAERGIRGAAAKILQTYFDLSDQAMAMSPRPEFVIWPETSYPSTFRTPDTAEELARDQRMERWVRDNGVTLLFGGYDRQDKKDFNAFFVLSPQAQSGHDSSGVTAESDLQAYRKNMLLLFGEYLPGAEQFTILKEWFPQVGNFGRGIGPHTVKLQSATRGAPRILAGPVICYEVLFPNYVVGAARKGSQLILNITNDSWFGPWGEPQLHLALTVFRSIETRLPQLRATNTGISALILPDGSIAQRSAIGQPEVMNVTVPILAPVRTPVIALGDWFGPTALALGALGALAFYFTVLGVRRSPMNLP